MKFERDMDRELQFHIEQAVADYAAQGMSPENARDRARREFGSVELAKEELRDTRPLRWAAEFWQDLPHPVQALRGD